MVKIKISRIQNKITMQNSIIFILLYLISFAYSDDSELGKYSLQPGLSGRLWDPHWTESDYDDHWILMSTYFRTGKYMDTATFLGTTSGVSDLLINYDENIPSTVYGFDIPTDLRDFVITLRGFYKAPASGTSSRVGVFNSELDSDGKYRASKGFVYLNITFGITVTPETESSMCTEYGPSTSAFFHYMFYDNDNTASETLTGSTKYKFIEGNLYPINIAISNIETMVNISQFSLIIGGVEYPFSDDNLFTVEFEDSDWADTNDRMFPKVCPIYATTTTYTGAQVTATTTIRISMSTYTDENGVLLTETVYVVATPTEGATSSSIEPIVSSMTDSTKSSLTTNNELSTSETIGPLTSDFIVSSASDIVSSTSKIIDSSTSDVVESSTSHISLSNSGGAVSSTSYIVKSSTIDVIESSSTDTLEFSSTHFIESSSSTIHRPQWSGESSINSSTSEYSESDLSSDNIESSKPTSDDGVSSSSSVEHEEIATTYITTVSSTTSSDYVASVIQTVTINVSETNDTEKNTYTTLSKEKIQTYITERSIVTETVLLSLSTKIPFTSDDALFTRKQEIERTDDQLVVDTFTTHDISNDNTSLRTNSVEDMEPNVVTHSTSTGIVAPVKTDSTETIFASILSSHSMTFSITSFSLDYSGNAASLANLNFCFILIIYQFLL